MTRDDVRINNKMFFLLVDNNINNFTVNDFRVHFRDLGLSSDDGKDRKFIYRQLFTLEAKELLEKKGSSYSRRITYHKTKLFYESTIKPKRGYYVPNSSPCLFGKIPKIEDLKRELVEVYTRLSVSTNESKEYREILDQYPDMNQKMREHYCQSRENSSRLLAKINALKTFIREHPHNDQELP